MKEKIAVIGAGNGGFAMAADLALDGYNVNLFEFPKFKSNINPVIETGGVEISGPMKTGFAKLNSVTTDLEKAITKCSCIMIVTQANAQDTLADMLVPIIKPGQTIFLLPGSAGSILMAKKFREQRVSSEVRLAETVTLPYICRKIGQNKVHVERRTGSLGIGAFPGEDIDSIFSVFQTMYPDSYKMQNVLEVGLCNTNFIAHPAPAIMSLSQIEIGKGSFNFYKDGCSPSVEKVIKAVNGEIASILDVLKFKTISPMAACEKRFGMAWDEIQEMRKKWDIKVNFDTDKRFFTEDVQVGLVLISSIGKQFEVPTPVCDSIIHLSGIVEETDYWDIGRTTKLLGLHRMNIEELNNFLQHGYQ